MSTKKPVILIADDDPEILTMLGIRLSKKGYEVLEAVDGEPDAQPGAQAPSRSGAARRHDAGQERLGSRQGAAQPTNEFSNVGIVMLTAIGEKVNEMTSPLYGADAYVDKPFDFSDLEKKIKDVLSERAQRS